MIDEHIWRHGVSSTTFTAFQAYGLPSLRCIDEGIPPSGRFDYAIQTPGSGILMPEKNLLELIKEKKIATLVTHDGCSAVKLYMEEHSIRSKRPDTFAVTWAEDIARKASIGHRHIPIRMLDRPHNRHIARVTYYIGTQSFSWKTIPYMPQGFNVSRRHLSVSDAQKAARMSFEIAIGPEGFLDFIKAEQGCQYIFIAVGDKFGSFSTEVLMAELGEITASMEEKAIVRGLSK
ncbi:MAG: hypothetical protein G01um101466_497 [Parcubacteria group bacterium Gr01-1014_66]|nr:MAG: hypothetical protein G01um101466_497 [Parcubacteria group bacterium Gr01-1014_66]